MLLLPGDVLSDVNFRDSPRDVAAILFPVEFIKRTISQHFIFTPLESGAAHVRRMPYESFRIALRCWKVSSTQIPKTVSRI